MFIATFVIALVASLIAGLLPAWRACVVAPAPQLYSVAECACARSMYRVASRLAPAFNF
jgi:hypothetical protein